MKGEHRRGIFFGKYCIAMLELGIKSSKSEQLSKIRMERSIEHRIYKLHDCSGTIEEREKQSEGGAWLNLTDVKEERKKKREE